MLDGSVPVFPVRIVLRRTGLTAELLRAWERRYQVVAPNRTPGGQRLYSEADIARLSLLRRGTLHGHSIGRIARLSSAELESLLADAAVTPARTADTPGESGAATVVRTCLEALQWMDGPSIENALRRAAFVMGPLAFAEQVATPFVREVGDLWHRGRLRLAQERFALSTVRQVVSGLLSFAPAAEDAPVFVAATPSGQHHEIGAMLSAAVAASAGWRAVYLGPDLPGEEIGIAAARLHAGAVGLSLASRSDDDRTASDLIDLAEAVGKTIPVYLGGEGARRHRARIESSGFQLVNGFAELKERLGRP